MTTDYMQADSEFFSIVDREGPALFATIKTTAFPETYRAMFGFCAKINSLKTAMFDMIESDNPYVFKALFRCYCEHYLKFLYLFVRFVLDKSDDVGAEYFSYCGAIEARDYATAISMAEGLLGNAVVVNIAEVLAAMYPIAAQLSMSDVESASNQFRYRSILRYLSREVPGMIARERPFLAKIVPSYALLSSFVHGGPWTDVDMANYSKPEALGECARDAELVFLITASVFMFTAASVAREYPGLGRIAAQVKTIIGRFLSESNHDEA